MKKSICLVAVLMCAWVSSFGQSNGQPQWKVVKEGHRTNSCVDVAPTVLFTPQVKGLYRFSGYLNISSKANHGTWTMVFEFTDRTGLEASFPFGVNLQSSLPWNTIGPSLFSPKPGTKVSIRVYHGDLDPDALCDTAFTIEKLTH